jgi:uncharacterized protein YggT (Ycf19 family)
MNLFYFNPLSVWISYLIPMENFNFFTSVVSSSESSKATSFFPILCLNLISYIYIMIKFYKLLCYAKLTCEWFPLLNPYYWPFSFFQAMTNPYFKIWSNLLPSLKFQKSSIEISGIIALEALNALIYFCVRSANLLILLLETTQKGS